MYFVIYVQMMLASQTFYIIFRQFHYLSGLALKYLLITLSFDILNDFSCLLESHQSNTLYSNVYIKANLIILALYIHVYYYYTTVQYQVILALCNIITLHNLVYYVFFVVANSSRVHSQHSF